MLPPPRRRLGRLILASIAGVSLIVLAALALIGVEQVRVYALVREGHERGTALILECHEAALNLERLRYAGVRVLAAADPAVGAHVQARASEARLRTLIEAAPLPLLLSQQSRVRYVNRRALELFELPEARLLGESSDVIYVDAGERDRLRAQVGADGEVRDWEIRLRRGDGSEFPALVSAVELEQGSEPVRLLAITDITERKAVEAELRRRAHRDALTGVANRGSLLERAERELGLARSRGWPLSVLLLDIDHFKRVNDSHGHPVGDRAIQAVAEVCARDLRGHDRVGRLGGEEFAVLLPGADAEAAHTVAERLRCAVEELALELPAGGTLRLTVSLGVATLAPADADLDALFARADAALYAAKRSGRNRVAMAPAA